MVATDRISAFDVVMPTGIPRKGEVLTQISLFSLLRRSRRTRSSRTTLLSLPRMLRRICPHPNLSPAKSRTKTREPLDAREISQAARHRVHRARLSFGQRLEGIAEIADGLRHQTAECGLKRIAELPGTDLHSLYESRGRSRRKHLPREGAENRWRRISQTQARESEPEDLQFGPRIRAQTGHHHRGHEI